MKIITEIKQKAQYLKKKTQTNYKLQSQSNYRVWIPVKMYLLTKRFVLKMKKNY